MSWLGVYNNYGNWAYDAGERRSDDLSDEFADQLGIVLLYIDVKKPQIRCFVEASSFEPFQLTVDYVPDDRDTIFQEFIDRTEMYLAKRRNAEPKKPDDTDLADDHTVYLGIRGDIPPESDLGLDEMRQYIIKLVSRDLKADIGVPDYPTAAALAKLLYFSDLPQDSTIAVTKSTRIEPIEDVDIVIEVGEYDEITPLRETQEALRQLEMEPLNAEINRFGEYINRSLNDELVSPSYIAQKLTTTMDASGLRILGFRDYAYRMATAMLIGGILGWIFSMLAFAPWASGVRSYGITLLETVQPILPPLIVALTSLCILGVLGVIARRKFDSYPQITGLSPRSSPFASGWLRTAVYAKSLIDRFFRWKSLLILTVIDALLTLAWAVPALA